MATNQQQPEPAQGTARPTLRTIADACGLAVTTVSRALNDGDDIALRTRQKVKKVANELGYVPDRAGRRLRTGRSQMVSLLLSPHESITGYTSAIISGIGDACRDSGYELSAIPEFPEFDELSAIKSIVQNKRADGIVLSRIQPQDIRIRYLLECDFPFVTHGRTELASSHSFVDFDNQRFAEIAAQRLADRGRRRLLLIGPPEGLTYQGHMKIGLQRGATRSDIEVLHSKKQIDLETPLEKMRDYVASVFDNKDKDDVPDGLVCSGELAAMAAMAGIRDAGLSIGTDVDVFAKQTSPVLDYVFPPIDTCFEDIGRTGRLLGETLLKVVNRHSTDDVHEHVIEPEVRLRASNR